MENGAQRASAHVTSTTPVAAAGAADGEGGQRELRLREWAVSKGRSSVPQTYASPRRLNVPAALPGFFASEYRSIARENTVVCGIVEAGQEGQDENS